jgi:hypothetical protein
VSHSNHGCLHPTQISSGTDNIINEKNGGYEHVTEYIPIAQPNAGTLAKLDELEPSTVIGDRLSYFSLLDMLCNLDLIPSGRRSHRGN